MEAVREPGAPAASDGDGKHGDPRKRPGAFKQVRGPKGGRLNRGGLPGGYDPVAHQLGMMKRQGRRVLAGWLKRLERIGDQQLERAEAATDPKAVLEHLKASDLPVRIIAQIAEPTTAEDKREDPSASDAPTIIVVATSGSPVLIPLPAEDKREDPSAPDAPVIFVRTDQTPPPTPLPNPSAGGGAR